MKKLFSTRYSDNAFNLAMLILRIGAGGLMLPHGYQKLMSFSSLKNQFMNFMGLGSTVSLCLVLFAELFCASLLILGLFTRFASLVLVILCSVIVFKVTHTDIFLGKGEHPALFLACFLTLLILGPGKISMDKLIGK